MAAAEVVDPTGFPCDRVRVRHCSSRPRRHLQQPLPGTDIGKHCEMVAWRRFNYSELLTDAQWLATGWCGRGSARGRRPGHRTGVGAFVQYATAETWRDPSDHKISPIGSAK